MQKIIYICDRCGKEVEGARYMMSVVDEGLYDADIAKDLCPDCCDSLMEWMKGEPEKNAKRKPGRPKKEPEAVTEWKRKDKIDAGKVHALADAGWDVKKISDDMHAPVEQIEEILADGGGAASDAVL